MKKIITIVALLISFLGYCTDINGSITSNSVARTFSLFAPGSEVATNLPVVIALHGDGGTGAGFKAYSGLDAVATANNFMVVYPNSLNTLGNGIWNKPINGDLNDGPNDVLFIADLIEHLCQTYAINRNKIYVTGHSGGAFMAYNLALSLPDKIAAIAPVAGNMYGDNTFINNKLQSSNFIKIPIYHIHGDADNVVSYPDSNHVPNAWSEYPLTAFSYPTCASTTYSAANVVDIVAGVKKIPFCTNSAASKEISLIRIVGGSHGWPNVMGFNAAQKIWEFFAPNQLNIAGTCSSSSTEQPSLLKVDGKVLKDDCGQTIILKGFNHGSIYDVSDFGVGEAAQIAQTGANAMRIVVDREYCTFPPPNYSCVEVATTAVQLTTMIQASLNNNMIPIVELHDFTGSANPASDLATAANWWSQPNILEVLKANQNYLILNIANEPSNSNYPPLGTEQTAYYNANLNAITILRNAGLSCPIMIDGMHWGKDHLFFVNHGAALMAADPLHKLIFSVHTYWPAGGNAVQVSDAQMTNYMAQLATVNAPIVLGEIAHDETQGSNIVPINYELLLTLSATHNFGYLIWWWGRIESGSTSPLYITTNGMFSGLTPHGNVFVNTHANAIATTATRPYKLVNGECNTLQINNFESKSKAIIYPNPFDDSFVVSSKSPIFKIELYDILGHKILESRQETVSTQSLSTGIYFAKIYTDRGTETIKIIKK